MQWNLDGPESSISLAYIDNQTHASSYPVASFSIKVPIEGLCVDRKLLIEVDYSLLKSMKIVS